MGAENFMNSSSVGVSGKRIEKRARVLLSAKLETPFGEVDVRLRDLSRKGALVECAKTLPVGTEVVFARGATSVPARVAWSGAGRAGLEFLYAIDEGELLVQLRKSSAGSSQPRFRRPGLNEVLTDDARKLAHAWGITVGINIPERDV